MTDIPAPHREFFEKLKALLEPHSVAICANEKGTVRFEFCDDTPMVYTVGVFDEFTEKLYTKDGRVKL